ncbi:unknown [Clostridium sp. CAG:448]|nr:unknown [Clostridium sp. CAG:448]
MAAAAGNIVKLFVGQLPGSGVQPVKTGLCLLPCQFDVIFLCKRHEFLGRLCRFCLFNQFGCDLVFHCEISSCFGSVDFLLFEVDCKVVTVSAITEFFRKQRTPQPCFFLHFSQ